MDKSIETIQATRKMFMKLMDGLSIDTLNKIPAGFNNNIIWNFGHLIVTQQVLCYKLSNLPLNIDESFVAKYGKGSKPEIFIDQEEFDFLKLQSLSLIDLLVTDLEKKLFHDFNLYTTSFNMDLTCIDDVIKFIGMHEGMHIGYAMALKRVVNL